MQNKSQILIKAIFFLGLPICLNQSFHDVQVLLLKVFECRGLGIEFTANASKVVVCRQNTCRHRRETKVQPKKIQSTMLPRHKAPAQSRRFQSPMSFDECRIVQFQRGTHRGDHSCATEFQSHTLSQSISRAVCHVMIYEWW